MKRTSCSAKILYSLLFLLAFQSAAWSQVRFDADFESGSLGKVERLDSVCVVVSPGDTVLHLSYRIDGHFDPANPIDTSLAPSANWYYFRMTGIGGKQIYLTTPDFGVAGYSFSYDGVHWEHLPLTEAPRHRLDKRFDRDTVYLALYNPYTYSYLQERLQNWRERPDVVLDTIGFSHEGRPLQLLHITDPSVPTAQKARIWVHGRIHPSETPASFLVDGLVEYLTSDTPEGRALRRQIDAYVLPFANPDGVVNGLSRSNARGVNQEINFGRSDDSTVVEVRAIKHMFEMLTADRPFDIMLNSHSQHTESATFWMHTGSTTTPAYFRKLWTFTGLVSSMNPCIRPLDMNFSRMASRYAEGWLWDHAGEETVALTIETPYNFYSFDHGLWTDDDNLRDFGKRTMQAIAEYLGLSLPGRYLVETPVRMKAGWEPFGDDTRSFLGDGAWQAVRDGASVTYRLDQLPAGRYDIYQYVAGDCIEPIGSIDLKDPNTGEWIDPGVHGWVYLDTIDQPRDGRFRYTRKDLPAGTTADALLLLRNSRE